MSTSIRIITFFLALHILNFSLDMPSYNSSTYLTQNQNTNWESEQDEIESILELVIETVLEQNDFFPDTEEADSQTESFSKKVDWITHSFLLKFSFFENLYTSSNFVLYKLQIREISQDILPPPPKA
ncbi:hypothetical protein V9L05_13695 [Bernardetia sp. Wsw4-3y2]|uniref:hypothetical protein n=1 Tax=unclassified Bernardetia TaxID=2647129 RepID=UPI0030CA5CC1